MVDVIRFADDILSEAISKTENMMKTMSLDCPGGSNGMPLQNWGALQSHGQSFLRTLNEVRRNLAKENVPKEDLSNAGQMIDSSIKDLSALVDGTHLGCAGGEHGLDPKNFGSYVQAKQALKAKLEIARNLLKEAAKQ